MKEYASDRQILFGSFTDPRFRTNNNHCTITITRHILHGAPHDSTSIYRDPSKVQFWASDVACGEAIQLSFTASLKIPYIGQCLSRYHVALAMQRSSDSRLHSMQLAV